MKKKISLYTLKKITIKMIYNIDFYFYIIMNIILDFFINSINCNNKYIISILI